MMTITEIAEKKRDPGIDFIKGCLVEVMILFHAVNYFVGAKHIALNYLDFVTGSYIFISGYLITNISAKRNVVSKVLATRMVVRGVKLLSIFIALNLAVNATFSTNYNNRKLGIDLFVENIPQIFVFGNKYHAVFEILLPIAYLQIVAAVLLGVFGKRWYLMSVLTVGYMCFCVAFPDKVSFLYFYLSMGLNGMALGLVKLRKAGVRSGAKIAIALSCVAGYFLMITAMKNGYLIYLFGVVSILCLLYLADQYCDRSSLWYGSVVEVGQYSLVSYLSQILFLQLLVRMSNLPTDSLESGLLAIVLTNLFVVGCVKLIAIARSRSSGVNRLYLWVFG